MSSTKHNLDALTSSSAKSYADLDSELVQNRHTLLRNVSDHAKSGNNYGSALGRLSCMILQYFSASVGTMEMRQWRSPRYHFGIQYR